MIRRAMTLATLVAAVCACGTPAQAADRPKGDTKLFAPVPAPGAPEPVVTAPDGTVYTATLNAESGDTTQTEETYVELWHKPLK